MAYRDFPLVEVAAAAAELHRMGADVHQKFTCSHCGRRNTMEEPNKFHRTGICENCDSVTDIEKEGCNYLVIASGQFAIGALLRDKREGFDE